MPDRRRPAASWRRPRAGAGALFFDLRGHQLRVVSLARARDDQRAAEGIQPSKGLIQGDPPGRRHLPQFADRACGPQRAASVRIQIVDRQHPNPESFEDLRNAVDVILVGVGENDEVNVFDAVETLDMCDESFAVGSEATIDDDVGETAVVGTGEAHRDGIAAPGALAHRKKVNLVHPRLLALGHRGQGPVAPLVAAWFLATNCGKGDHAARTDSGTSLYGHCGESVEARAPTETLNAVGPPDPGKEGL
jgi:hypothetical protein